MLTIEKLKEYGANTEEGLARCMNNEAFYIRLVNIAIADDKLGALGEKIESGDLSGAFEIAHGLKGMYGNLSLTPVFEPISKMTELLRARTETDYSSLLAEVNARKKELDDLAK